MSDSSYIDYAAFTDPSFSPSAHANSLVLRTNNPSDSPLDLSTPLSRLLFDVQEVDTRIDTLATANALPLIQHTQTRSDAAHRLLDAVERQVQGLADTYARLDRDIRARHAAADQLRLAATHALQTLRLARALARALTLARTLDTHIADLARPGPTSHRAMLPAANALLSLRQLFAATGPGQEAEGLPKVLVAASLRQDLINPGERTLLSRAQHVVREFSLSSLASGSGSATMTATSTPTFAQAEETKARATSALQTLYLLSPTKPSTTLSSFDPSLLLAALQSYLQTAVTASLAALARALATLPTLDRTLLELSARCQNIVALEALLGSTRPPLHPLLTTENSTASAGDSTGSASDPPPTFLPPLLQHLDTPSLPSYFWRSIASLLSARVNEIVSRGGVSARTLKSNRDRVRDAIRECVDRGSQMPGSGLGLSSGSATATSTAAPASSAKVGGWEREAAVMVGAVMGPLSGQR